MTSIFPKWTNRIREIMGLAAFGGLCTVVAIVWYYFTPKFWEVGYMPEQPIAFSHQLHAGQLGMDCRYCHSHVEQSYSANVPQTSTCMNCHTAVDAMTGYLKKATSADGQTPSAHWTSPELAPIRGAAESGRPIEWDRVHKLPDYAQFPHMAHVNAGVSCYSCHGRIDTMPVVYQKEPLSMGWCLECHRNPEKFMVDTTKVKVTDLRAVESLLSQPNYAHTTGVELVKQRLRNLPPQNCAACHY